MKKKLLLLFALFSFCTVKAEIFTVDSLTYMVYTGTTDVAILAYVTEPTGELIIPETVVNNGITYTVTSILNAAFRGCTGLTSVVIPDSVTTIGTQIFSGCSGLTSVNIGNSVTSIGDYVFYNCTKLTSIELPNSLTSIDFCAFRSCKGLKSMIIPDSVVSIGAGAFQDCNGLVSVNIPNSLTLLSDDVFQSCHSLASINIPNSITSIGVQSFGNCYALTSVTIPSSVTSIGLGVFFQCYGLSSVTIPSSVNSIGAAAFRGCTSLTSMRCAITPPLPFTIFHEVFKDSNQGNCALYVPANSVDAYRSSPVWESFGSFPNTVPSFTQVAPICAGSVLNELPTISNNDNNGIAGVWSPALDNTKTTTYTFTPTIPHADPTTMDIVVIPYVTPVFESITPICSGTAIMPLPTTSTNGIKGTWSPALNNTATTTYTFTPMAGQCVNPEVVTLMVTVNPNTVPVFTSIPAIHYGETLSDLPTTSINGVTGTWSPAMNNLETTVYTFTPTAGLCAVSEQLTVEVIPNTDPIFTQIAPICIGETLSDLPTTSTNGITGTWSPAMNNTATTTYTFTPDSGLLYVNPARMTIVVNQKITPIFTQIAPTCSGAKLAALPTTSINGVTGTWSPAPDNLKTTVYTFTPLAGQCVASTLVTMTIEIIPYETPVFEPVDPICSGTSLSPLPTTSINGITGTWSPALNNLATTTYTFTPDAGQCVLPIVITLTITVNPNIAPIFTQVSDICLGSSFTLPTTSENGITGTWSPPIDNTATTTYTFTPTPGLCATSSEMTINVKTIPVFAPISPICSGESVSALPTTSMNGATGIWTPAINNTTTTDYTFTPADFVTIAAGGDFTMGIKTDGTLWAWGNNDFDQLGSSGTGTIIPLQIGIGTNWKNIACGELHTVAIQGDGTLWAWGNNDFGQLGDGTRLSKDSPVRIGTGTNWKTVAAKGNHSIAIQTDGTLWAWGNNGYGQLGDGTRLNSTIPKKIGNSFNWKTVSAGYYHTIAIQGDGTLWAWGNNSQGQLGDGTTTSRYIPTKIGTVVNWMNTVAGEMHTIALQTDGTLWAWGNNDYGQLGDNTTLPKYAPVKIGATIRWKSIGAGVLHTFATQTDGTLWTWGYNGFGQLGDDTIINKMVPVKIGSARTWTSITGGNVHTVALKSDGTLWAWGYNASRQLGDGTGDQKINPTQIEQSYCASTMTIAVTPIAIPTFTAIAPLCSGSSFTLPTTSNNGITGTWSPAINTTATTTYTFTPDANQCADSAMLTIAITASLDHVTTATACGSYTWANNNQVYTTSGIYTGTTTNCVTEKLDLTITPISDHITTQSACGSYLWNGITYTTSGIYTGATNNCVTEKLDLTITPNSDNITQISACRSYTWNNQTYTQSGTYTGTTNNCVTEKLDLTITPNSDNVTQISACGSYTWNNQTYTQSGIYTGTTNNCVTEKLDLTITAIPTNILTTVNQNNGVLTANQAGIGYQWLYCDGTEIAGETNQFFTPTNSGQYAVRLIVACSVPIISDCVTITSLKTDDFEARSSIKIYPNPSTGIFYLQTPSDKQLEIYNSLGQLLIAKKVNSETNKIDISDKADGVYFVKIIENGNTNNFKVIKKH